MSKTVTVDSIAEVLGAVVLGDGTRSIDGAGSLAAAGPTQLAFVDGPKNAAKLASSKAGAVIVPEGIDPPEGMSGVRFPHPALGMAHALRLLRPYARRYSTLSADAHVDASAELGEGVGVGPTAVIGGAVKIGDRVEIYPGVTLGDGVTIGDDTRLHAGVHVYHGCTIGARCILHAGAVIGADGYGYVPEPTPDTAPDEPARHLKVEQIGKVVIEDDVEIGANSTVDRAAFDSTRVGRGTKIDDQVMVAHNCQIGRHCLLVAQVGLAGSVSIGDYAVLAGQVGVAGHLEIGARSTVGAQAGVTKSVPGATVVWGTPARDIRLARRNHALLGQLSRQRDKVRDHEARLRALEARISAVD